jgi:hypothetical protein
MCPFDFSLLADVDLSSISVWDQVTTALIRGARRTITRLKLNAGTLPHACKSLPLILFADNGRKYGPDGMKMLATLPALRHLSLVSEGMCLEDIGMIIALLPSSNCVAFIDLYIRPNQWIRDDIWSRLASAIAASLLSLRRIHIQIHFDALVLDAAVLRTQLLTAFAEFETRGQLELPPFRWLPIELLLCLKLKNYPNSHFSYVVVTEVGRGALRHDLVYAR